MVRHLLGFGEVEFGLVGAFGRLRVAAVLVVHVLQAFEAAAPDVVQLRELAPTRVREVPRVERVASAEDHVVAAHRAHGAGRAGATQRHRWPQARRPRLESSADLIAQVQRRLRACWNIGMK